MSSISAFAFSLFIGYDFFKWWWPLKCNGEFPRVFLTTHWFRLTLKIGIVMLGSMVNSLAVDYSELEVFVHIHCYFEKSDTVCIVCIVFCAIKIPRLISCAYAGISVAMYFYSSDDGGLDNFQFIYLRSKLLWSVYQRKS